MWDCKLDENILDFYTVAHFNDGKATWTLYFETLEELKSLAKRLQKPAKKLNYIKKCLNDLITIGNYYSGDSLSRLLFYYSKPISFSDIKTFLLYIHRLPSDIPEVDLKEIPINTELYDTLSVI